MRGRTPSSALFPVHRRRASRSAHHTWDSELATRQHLNAFRRNENLPPQQSFKRNADPNGSIGTQGSKPGRAAIFPLVGRSDQLARRRIDLDRMSVALLVTLLQHAVTPATQFGKDLRMSLSH